MEKEKRDNLRFSLISDWNETIDKILDIKFWGKKPEKEIEKPLNYDNVFELIKNTKKYFDNLPIKGSLYKDDIELYEVANSLRYLPNIYIPNENKEDYLKASKEIKEYFENFESHSK